MNVTNSKWVNLPDTTLLKSYCQVVSYQTLLGDTFDSDKHDISYRVEYSGIVLVWEFPKCIILWLLQVILNHSFLNFGTMWCYVSGTLKKSYWHNVTKNVKNYDFNFVFHDYWKNYTKLLNKLLNTCYNQQVVRGPLHIMWIGKFILFNGLSTLKVSDSYHNSINYR